VRDAGGELPLERLAHLGHVVAQHAGADAAEEVEVAAARRVSDAAALAADQLNRGPVHAQLSAGMMSAP